VNQQNLARFHDLLRSRRIPAALLSSPWTIAWLTGYAPPVQTGPSPFETGPALAWWCDGEITLITSDAEAPAARATGAPTREYVGYCIEDPLTSIPGRHATVLREVLTTARCVRSPVGIEEQFLPASVLPVVQDVLAGATLQPMDGAFAELRAVKTPEEIGKLRRALALCDLGQATVRENLRAGVAEIALFAETKGRMEAAAGTRLPLLADFVGGVRTGEMGGLPGTYTLREGDGLITDLVPRLDAYWGDNCGTHYVGAPSPEMQRRHAVVGEALRRGIDAVRPGVRARDLDALLRGAVRDAGYEPHPHHSGHGIGVSFHEEPRIVPYNDTPLAPGMVVALEPGVYLPGVGGVRLEDVVLVTEDGCEVLTRHLRS
jgi:Xaa-Pro dipeptidase